MLQKSQASRYDYPNIANHPFVVQKSSVLKENKVDFNVVNNCNLNLGRIEEED